MQVDRHGEYFWGRTDFHHELCMFPDDRISIRHFPESMQVAMFGNHVKATTSISTDHIKWINEHCANPAFVGDDYILFSDETDRTLFLTAHA